MCGDEWYIRDPNIAYRYIGINIYACVDMYVIYMIYMCRYMCIISMSVARVAIIGILVTLWGGYN